MGDQPKMYSVQTEAGARTGRIYYKKDSDSYKLMLCYQPWFPEKSGDMAPDSQKWINDGGHHPFDLEPYLIKEEFTFTNVSDMSILEPYLLPFPPSPSAWIVIKGKSNKTDKPSELYICPPGIRSLTNLLANTTTAEAKSEMEKIWEKLNATK